MKRTLLTTLFFLCSLWMARATHIVGGEIEMEHIEGFTYRISLIMYFDEVNGNAGAKDPSVIVSVFRKSDNSLITNLELDLLSDILVNYTNNECAVGSLSTSRLFYSLTLELDPTIYNEEEGYYMSYQRCCRNDIIQNIEAPFATGQAFYLEFPPIVKNGVPFVNSTPQIFPPLSDYACMGVPFYFDFGGNDLDGDSLVYSISTPLAGTSSDQQGNVNPIGVPGPYPGVTFLEGYSEDAMIAGTPPLAIDQTGFITITPSELGLFVFAINCEEYRNGEKIGEVRRDYQMLVIDCPVVDPPEISSVQDSDGNSVTDGQTLVFDTEQTDNCLKVTVSDPNADTQFNTLIVPINYTSNEIEIRNLPQGIVGAGEEVTFELCLKECPSVNGVYEFLFLVGDNSCAKPQYDSIPMSFEIINENAAPTLVSNLAFNAAEDQYEVALAARERTNFNLFASDPDTDSLAIVIEPLGVNLSALGFQIENETGLAPLTANVSFAPTCELLTADFQTRTHLVAFAVEEYNKCGEVVNRRRIFVEVTVNPPLRPNQLPSLAANIINEIREEEVDITVMVGETYTFDLVGDDIDRQNVTLTGEGIGFAIADIPEFSFSNAQGLAPVLSTFTAVPTCQLLGPDFSPQTYSFEFLVVDENECGAPGTDVLRLNVTVRDKEQPPLTPFPNVFTPGLGDMNNEFYIENLPLDDCQDEFVGVQVFNRWGEEVFRGEDRAFQWTGEGYPSGVYFYLVKFRNKSYKGQIHLMREKQ